VSTVPTGNGRAWNRRGTPLRCSRQPPAGNKVLVIQERSTHPATKEPGEVRTSPGGSDGGSGASRKALARDVPLVIARQWQWQQPSRSRRRLPGRQLRDMSRMRAPVTGPPGVAHVTADIGVTGDGKSATAIWRSGDRRPAAGSDQVFGPGGPGSVWTWPASRAGKRRRRRKARSTEQETAHEEPVEVTVRGHTGAATRKELPCPTPS
jgi:hypothetical protein